MIKTTKNASVVIVLTPTTHHKTVTYLLMPGDRESYDDPGGGEAVCADASGWSESIQT